MVEDRKVSGRVATKMVPLITPDDVFIAVVECVGFIKGASSLRQGE